VAMPFTTLRYADTWKANNPGNLHFRRQVVYSGVKCLGWGFYRVRTRVVMN
jgi:hypothetical protein